MIAQLAPRRLQVFIASVAAFARPSNGGLIVTASKLADLHRDLIVTLAARHKLPAVYNERYFVAAGGLISYGPDFINLFRQSAGYVDRRTQGLALRLYPRQSAV